LGKLWVDVEWVNSIAFFLAPETCQSERGFRLWLKWPAWGRNVQELKRRVRVLKRPYINFGELVCQRVGVSASWLSASWTVGELDCLRVRLSASCPVTALK